MCYVIIQHIHSLILCVVCIEILLLLLYMVILMQTLMCFHFAVFDSIILRLLAVAILKSCNCVSVPMYRYFYYYYYCMHSSNNCCVCNDDFDWL